MMNTSSHKSTHRQYGVRENIKGIFNGIWGRVLQAESTLSENASAASRSAIQPGLRANHKLALAQQVGQPGNSAWNGLGAALRKLESGAGACPPLKSAFNSVIACLDVFKAALETREDYEELTRKLQALAETLSEYTGELGEDGNTGSIARIAQSIETEATYIAKQKTHGQARRMIESERDHEDVTKCYQRIETLFQQLQSNMNLRAWKTGEKQYKIQLLDRLSPVDDAQYNSGYSTTVMRHGCTAETRQQVQENIHHWIQGPHRAGVYWMSGMAGTGKTTIAYSLCEWLEEHQLLGASFFCSSVSSSCRDASRVVPTIATQLAQYSPAFRSSLCKTLERNPTAGKLNEARQFELLIRDPLVEIKGAIPDAVVVVIDALDECEDKSRIRLLLSSLLRVASDLPIKFFLTSRPEPIIRDHMRAFGQCALSILQLHNIEKSIVENDIKKYLKEALEYMAPAPSEAEIERLAKQAGNLFIYAATAVRYILPDNGCANSRARLNSMLVEGSHLMAEGSTRKYKKLDALYEGILATAFGAELEQEEKRAMELVLRLVICAKEPMDVRAIAVLLDLDDEQVSSALRPLHSVLHISDASGLVSTLHSSFGDYMLDQSRSGGFHCDEARYSLFLLCRCFEIMRCRLHFNMCNLESSFILDKGVLDLEQRVKENIDPALFYACRYWGDHLRIVDMSELVYKKVEEFLVHRLLFWIEVLNLKKCIGVSEPILMQAHNWLLANKISDHITTLVADARSFAMRFAASTCSLSTCHLYTSALAFCPKESTVYKNYIGRFKGLVSVAGTLLEGRSRAALAAWKTESVVMAVATSPNSGAVAVGMDDGTVWVRDGYTGKVMNGPLRGHVSTVYSVAFSPDGTCVASGSEDKTVCIWDTCTSNLVAGPFQGHQLPIFSVAFAPGGTCVASGSCDATIQVWNVRTGAPTTSPFRGHTDQVNSVAYSPDGNRIVSGSNDMTVRVWDALTGSAPFGPFRGHTESVSSVAYSPNGRYIVSGSWDATICIWDACVGNLVAGPVQGHESPISTVAYSPDGSYIASGSSDTTIRLWNACTASLIGHPLKGHSDQVNTIAFSPDSTRIVSGSYDGTIKVWNARIDNTTPAINPFRGHTLSVNSIAFSSDGTHIASGSLDSTIQVWNTSTGQLVAGPFEGHTSSVYCVAFSPDDSHIVSGSDDMSILVWDACAGGLVAGPFEEHTDAVYSVSYSPDGRLVVSGSGDKTIVVWDASNGDLVAGPFLGHADSISSVAYSPDGAYIVSGSWDATVRVWNAITGKVVARPSQKHTSSVYSVAFSPDGTCIASGSEDMTIQLWDVRTGNPVGSPLQGHAKSVNSVAFSPDGTYIVSGSDDCSVRVWDTRTGHPIVEIPRKHADRVSCVIFSPDGTRIASSSNDKDIQVWLAPGSPTNISPKHTNDNRPFTDGSGTVAPTRLAKKNRITRASEQNYVSCTLEGYWVPGLENWIADCSGPLFWLPPDLQDVFPSPPNPLRIFPRGSIVVNYSELLVGKRWPECYLF